jgi:hypothetical protein
MLAKISKQLAYWLGLFVIIFISFWVAGQREPQDGWYYFVTAAVVGNVLWWVYWALIFYLLPLAWSRWRRSSN